MENDLKQLRDTWSQLGRDDPFWAVISHPEKRGGKWNSAEFFETGRRTVTRLMEMLQTHAPEKHPFDCVLDFGCGLGRLTAALGSHAAEVFGVDISEPMIHKARQLNLAQNNVRFVLNERKDLSCFDDHRFDLILSLICLQHMPWTLASGYVREFTRIARPNGLIVFQLPSRVVKPNRAAAWRQSFVNSLPFGLGKAYRQWKHGTSAVFEMHYTPQSEVERLASSLSIKQLACIPDTMTGPNTESFLYIYQSPEMARLP